MLEVKKARHRLVGAVALCLVAAVLVPLLLESEPRDAARALPITIESAFDSTRPEKPWIEPPPQVDSEPLDSSDRIAALQGDTNEPPPEDGEGQMPSRLEPVPMQPPPQPAKPSPAEPAQRTSPAAPPPPASARPPAQPAPGAARNTPANPPAGRGAPASSDEDNDTLSRLIEQVNRPAGEGSGAKPPDRRAARRFLVQVGAYSNVKSARAASERVSRAGLSAYHETVKTSNGDWIRVRIGPFASREEAEQAQQALKRAGVVAALIAL
ncbi:MAG: SPOR domain-containing protein [Lautropia sp.]|nr:SPOR domain-containing protein [Lautropia sp.]